MIRSCLVFFLYVLKAFSKMTVKLEEDDDAVAVFVDIDSKVKL